MRSRCVGAARVGMALSALCILEALPARAGLGLAFPADEAFVPLAVGAAFALPALVALIYISLERVLRALGRLVAFGALAALGIVVAEFVRPGMVSGPAGALLQRWPV